MVKLVENLQENGAADGHLRVDATFCGVIETRFQRGIERFLLRIVRTHQDTTLCVPHLICEVFLLSRIAAGYTGWGVRTVALKKVVYDQWHQPLRCLLQRTVEDLVELLA